MSAVLPQIGKVICCICVIVMAVLLSTNGRADNADEAKIAAEVQSQIQKDWQVCSVGQDCQVVAYGNCWSQNVATNIKHVSDVRAVAYRIGSHPPDISCYYTPPPSRAVALCADMKCVVSESAEK